MRVILYCLTLGFLFATVAQATEYDCDKKYCKAMVSCDEAYYKLKICDDDSLDRDGDGVPCESVCGKGGKKQSKKSKQQIKTLLAEQEKEQNEESETDNSKTQ